MRLADSLFVAGEHRCISVFGDGPKPKTYWYTDNDKMMAHAVRASEAGHNVYWSPVVFAERGRRVIDKALHIRALWLDIDIRKAEGAHHTFNEAATALLGFISKNKLPQPTVVHSGGGLHVYWTLDRALTADVWLEYARALTAAAGASGLLVDVGASVNRAGLLRPPTTINHKYGTPVKCGTVRPASSTDALMALLEAHRIPVAKRTRLSLPDAVRNGPAKSLDYGLTPEYDFPAILSGCAQMRNAPTGDEPLWRAGLMITSMMPDGRECSHKWSALDTERYDEDTVDAKLNSLPDESMPTRCETFARLNPGGCDSCPQRGRLASPISLGYIKTSQEPMKLVTPLVVSPPPSLATGGSAPTFTAPEFRRDADVSLLPFTPASIYSISDNGTPMMSKKIKSPDGTEKIINVELLGYSVAPVAHVVTRDITESNATVWRFRDSHRAVDITIENTILANASDNAGILKSLGARSVIIADADVAKAFCKFLRLYFIQLQYALPERQRIVKFGWQHDKSFVTGSTHLRSNQTSCEAFALGSAGARQESLRAKGSVEAWRAVPAIYKQQGNYAAQYALLQSFASPLMYLSAHKGMLVHLYTRASGTGKSTICRAINSVWGDPDGLLLTARDTVLAQATLFSLHNSLPIAIDETTNMEGKAASDLLFAITQGAEKHRLRQDASLRGTGTWALVAVTTGNESMRGKLSANKRSDNEAENLRLLELPLPEIQSTNDTRVTLEKALAENHGVAGEVYSEWLTANRETVRREVNRCEAAWVEKMKAKPSERFWVASLAITEVACRLAQAAGLIDFDWDAISAWVIATMLPAQRHQAKESVDEHSGTDIIEDVRQYYQDQTLVIKDGVVGGLGTVVVEPKSVAVRYYPDSGTFYITAAAVRDYLRLKGVALSRWKEAVMEATEYAVTGNTRVSVTAGMTGGGTLGAVRCWTFARTKDERT
jgi:Domain of unknown function (DUF927)